MPTIPHWIGGTEHPGGTTTSPVHDPATGEQVAEVPHADADLVAAAVVARTEELART